MAFISDYVLDAALTVFTNDANRLDITSQEPTTYTEATSTYTLGNKTGITVSSPGDGTQTVVLFRLQQLVMAMLQAQVQHLTMQLPILATVDFLQLVQLHRLRL